MVNHLSALFFKSEYIFTVLGRVDIWKKHKETTIFSKEA